MTKMEIIEIYENLAFNNDYIIGFELNKKVVACVLSLTAEMIDNITSLGKSSSKNGGSSSIRFRPNKEQKEYIIRNSVKIDEIMEAEEFENLHKNTEKANRGDVFEMVVAKFYNGQRQQQRNLNWRAGGDVIINGHQYQCKYNKATWTTEATVMRAVA